MHPLGVRTLQFTNFPLKGCSPRALTSGQLSHDRRQRVGEGGADDDDIGEADLLPLFDGPCSAIVVNAEAASHIAGIQHFTPAANRVDRFYEQSCSVAA